MMIGCRQPINQHRAAWCWQPNLSQFWHRQSRLIIWAAELLGLPPVRAQVSKAFSCTVQPKLPRQLWQLIRQRTTLTLWPRSRLPLPNADVTLFSSASQTVMGIPPVPWIEGGGAQTMLPNAGADTPTVNLAGVATYIAAACTSIMTLFFHRASLRSFAVT